MQAKFSYLDKKGRSTGSAAWFGSIIHEAVDSMNRGKSLEEAEDYFLEKINSTEPDYWNRRTTLIGYKESGLSMLANYAEYQKFNTAQTLGSEFRFMIDIGEHQVSGIVDKMELPMDRSSLNIVDFKTGKRPIYDTLYLDIQFCADSETELLTKRGWKAYNEVIIGEDILTLNQDGDYAEWQPALDIHTFDAKNQELISFEGKGHSSLTTKNHRWLVEKTDYSNGIINKLIMNSDSLKASHRIPCAKPVINLPQHKKYEDEFVEMVGWFWTEGHVVNGGSLSLAQKAGDDFDRILKKAIKLWGEPLDSLRNPERPRESLDFPAFRVVYAEDANRFYLNRIASSELYEAFSDIKEKVLDSSFISSLTLDQLNLLIDVSVMADGSEQNNVRSIEQSSKARLESFSMVCQLAGIRTSLVERQLGGSGPYADHYMWRLSLKEKMPYFLPASHKKSIISYTGKVWCPRTKNGSWLARRNGSVYFTGNTIYNLASTMKEFWVGYPGEEDYYSGIENGEELFYELRDLPREAYWHDLKSGETIYVGDRTGRDYARLYRLIEQVGRAVEHEVFIPTLNGDTCTWCDHTDVCPVYFDNVTPV